MTNPTLLLRQGNKYNFGCKMFLFKSTIQIIISPFKPVEIILFYDKCKYTFFILCLLKISVLNRNAIFNGGIYYYFFNFMLQKLKLS